MAMAKKRRIIDFFPGPLTSSDVDHPIDPISKVKKNHSLRQDCQIKLRCQSILKMIFRLTCNISLLCSYYQCSDQLLQMMSKFHSFAQFGWEKILPQWVIFFYFTYRINWVIDIWRSQWTRKEVQSKYHF
jgi:hypothetical protein